MATRTCPVCGTAHAACGAGTAPAHIVDIPATARRPKMAELALYTVKHRNFETTMQLSEEDAAALGATRVGDVEPTSPEPVTRPSHAVDPDVDADESAVEGDEKQARAARNKARSTKS